MYSLNEHSIVTVSDLSMNTGLCHNLELLLIEENVFGQKF
jgi:hypothetical protein